jgi:hypothetical protein
MAKDCQCAFCKAKRGDYNAQNNPNYKNGLRVLTNKVCLYCNKKFIAYANRKYCSRNCMNKYIWQYTDKKQIISETMRGKNSPRWKGGISSLESWIRSLPEYEMWRTKVFERDHFTCQECNQVGGKLRAHHKKRFIILIREFLKQYNQFSPLEDKETLVRLAISYELFWNLDNGITLCKKCHHKIHKEKQKGGG